MPNLTVNSAEQRRGFRKTAVQEQICIVELGADRSAMLLDLSELGMGVQCVQGVPQATTTSFRFLLPSSPAIITGEGEVAWADARGRIGIRFTNLAPEMKKVVADWVNSEANPLFGDEAEAEAVSEEEARDRVAHLEARIMMAGWADVQSLNFLVDQVAAMTQASGVAIAVEDGDGIVCKASSGTAPQAGVRINARSGLSWECARTGEVVHCVDTETDPRVDRMVCRELNMRSAMLVPVMRNGRVIGLVEVFSSRAQAFSSKTVFLLKRVAEAVGALDELSSAPVNDESPVAPQDGQATAPAPPAAPKVTAVSSSAAAAAKPAPLDTPTPVSLTPVAAAKPAVPPASAEEVAKPVAEEVTKPAGAIKATKAPPTAVAPNPAAEAPIPASVSRPIRVAVEKTSPASAASPAEAAETRATAPVKPFTAKSTLISAAPAKAPAQAAPGEVTPKRAQSAQPKAAPIPRVSKPVPERVAATERKAVETSSEPEMFGAISAKPSGSRKIAIGIAAAAILLAAGAYEGVRWMTPATSAKPAATEKPIPAQQPVLPPTVPPVTSTATQTPAPPTASNGSGTSQTVAGKTAAQTPTIEVAEPASQLRVPMAHHVTEPTSTLSEAPAAILAPSPAGIANILSETAVMPSLSREEVSKGVTGGKQILRVQPVYPANARSMRISGTVVLQAHVSKAGTVSSVDVVSGNPMLASAAVAAVRRWRYEPYLLNGEPIENVVTVQIKFNAQ